MLSGILVMLAFAGSHSPTESNPANAEKALTEWKTLRGHRLLVRCLAYAPDGRLASGGQDNRICVWSSTGKMLQQLDLTRVTG